MVKKSTRPKILLTNDDGINAVGIKAAYNALSTVGDCVVVAPDGQRSAMGHAITMHTPLRFRKNHIGDHDFGYSMTGTTADCVKFAVHEFMDTWPDLIVSGINQGENTAVNIMYSGTVAGAAEGALMNIPALAISLSSYTEHDFSFAGEICKYFAEQLLEKKLPDYTFLNVNVPAVARPDIKGIKVTRMGRMRYEEDFERRKDPNDHYYYWLAGRKVILDHADDADEIANQNNYVTVTPLVCDMTNYNAIDALKEWNLKL